MVNKTSPIRAVGLLIHNGSVLLMGRVKNGEHFDVFPGGHVEDGERAQDAVRRELFEETSVVVEVGRLLYILHAKNNQYGPIEQYVYFCKYISGEPVLGECEERYRTVRGVEEYHPKWEPLDALVARTVYPLVLRNQVIKDSRDGFAKTSRVLDV